MWLDLVFFVLLIAAFASGLQDGIMKSFGWIVMFCLAGLTSILAAPYLIQFLDYSFGFSQLPIQIIILILFFLFFMWLITRPLVAARRHPESKNIHWGLRLSGALTMVFITLFSLSILTGFLEKADIFPVEEDYPCFAHQLTKPVRHSTGVLWEELKTGVNDVGRKGKEVTEFVNQN
ncbi:MAG: hypothetical protein OEQ53_02445 [Saprospiraceae bacterium]|nr:hypothetical protein [Saprospiraceae bacterium]